MSTEKRSFLIATNGQRYRVDADTYVRGQGLPWYPHPKLAGAARTRVRGRMITLGRFALAEDDPDLQVWRINRAAIRDADGLYYDYRRANLATCGVGEVRPQAVISEDQP